MFNFTKCSFIKSEPLTEVPPRPARPHRAGQHPLVSRVGWSRPVFLPFSVHISLMVLANCIPVVVFTSCVLI